MDERKHLIIVKNENKTRDIQSCRYNSQTRHWDVTFTSGKTYHYAYQNVEWLKDPQALNPNLYRIGKDGRFFGHVQAIWTFGSRRDWWHIAFDNGVARTYPRHELTIEKSCLDNERAKSHLDYLRDIAGINELKNDDGEVLLKIQYEKLPFVGENTVLANYLHPNKYPIKQYDAGTLIFPFGGNASQFKAVQNALSKQMSVIQGPPGTGKTQTILNIIANLLIRGKTVQVVSNNNSATKNVLEKLASPKYALDFLVATLGKRENKEAFIAQQTGQYPDISSWRKSPEEVQSLREQINKLSEEVSACFAKQERLALAKQELNALELEQEHFTVYYDDSGLPRPVKIPRPGVKAITALQVLQECEITCEAGKNIDWWLKCRGALVYGLFEWKFFNQDVSAVISYLQSLFYTLKYAELMSEIRSLQDYLTRADAKTKMELLTKWSMDYLKAHLFEKYGNRPERHLFCMEDIWRTPIEILKEYPIALSTTFSSRSCLKNAEYDYVIMDEASQVDLATGALALASAKNAVIVGDLKQLPNVIPETMRKQSEALFQSYQLPQGYNYAENSFLKSICTVIPELPQTLLREHYRCHPKIIGFCNQKFYQGQLVIMTEDKDEPDTLCVYKTVEGSHHRGHINQRQIDVTEQEVLPRLYDTKPEDIGIIAPYRDQVRAFASIMQNTGVEVDTVHKFQGREKDAIIITTVDDAVTDFSDDPYLLNVAISRAKKKLCLVTSDNEQPSDSNIRDLVAYIQYNNFDVVDSQIYSVFDLLYQQYTQQRLEYLAKHRKVSEYDSENLMYGQIVDLLEEMPNRTLSVICHQSVRMLLKDTSKLTGEERRYALHPNTHVDFLIYNQLTKEPVLAIEVDGFRYHRTGTRQAERDFLKNSIFEKYEIPLLRLATNGSGEIEKIKGKLL